MSSPRRRTAVPIARVASWMIAALAMGAVAALAATPKSEATSPPMAALPLTNLSGTAEAAAAFDGLLLAELAHHGPVVETGVVEAAMDSLRLRPTASLSIEEMRALRRALGVRYLVLGTVLEHGTVRTPDAQYPCSGLVLKVLDADSARVIWTRSRFRCGDDRETVFGWGRDFDPKSVAARVTADLCRELRHALVGGSPRPRKGSSS